MNHLKRCKTSNLGFLFNVFYKFARGLEPICLSRRSYGISVDEWSDQPLVAALFFPSLWQGAKPRTPSDIFYIYDNFMSRSARLLESNLYFKLNLFSSTI